LVSTQVWKRPVFKALLPLLLTKEGGEIRIRDGERRPVLLEIPLPLNLPPNLVAADVRTLQLNPGKC
jgi:hypothetical protein